MGVPLTTHTSTHSWFDSQGLAVDPDDDTEIVWQVFDSLNRELSYESQALGDADKVDTGVYRYHFVPPIGLTSLDGFRVCGTVTIDGKPEAAWSDLVPVELPE